MNKNQIIIQLIGTIVGLLSPERLEAIWGKIAGFVTGVVEKSDNTVDDIILAIVKSGDFLKEMVDIILDVAEDLVEGTKTPWDDIIILPICNIIRKTFDIPDNDEPDDKAGA